MMMASPAVSAISKMSNDELRRLGPDELIRLLRKSEGDRLQLLAEHNGLMKDVNKKMQVHLLEIRGLKEVNGRLQQDNQELRDLCCFLDDDRQKRSKMAREWQRFGRYTSSVMKSEVSAYQEKLKELETNQEEMLKENIELKELCLYLDKERENGVGEGGGIGIDVQRDQGDGSSNSTTDGQTDGIPNGRQQHMEEALNRQRGGFNDRMLKYIKSLESKISQMESDKRGAAQRLEPSGAEIRGQTGQGAGPASNPPQHHGSTQPPAGFSASQSQYRNRFFSTPQINAGRGPRRGSLDNLLSMTPTGRTVYGAEENIERNQPPQQVAAVSTTPVSKPEAVVHAMKILEVHEQLELPQPTDRDTEDQDLDDTEKALLREMCNVVWRKLEDEPEER